MTQAETSYPSEELCEHFFRDTHSKRFIHSILNALDFEAVNGIRTEGDPDSVAMIRAIDRIRNTLHATAQQNGHSFNG